MHIVITEFTEGNCFAFFPRIYWGHRSLFFFPIAIHHKRPMRIWFLPYSYLLLEKAIIFAFRVFKVIYPCHPMRMPFLNQSIHPFFLSTRNHFKLILLMPHRDGISRFEFYCIALIFETISWFALQGETLAVDQTSWTIRKAFSI